MEGKENDSTKPPAEPGEQEKVYQICDECGKPTAKCECVALPKSKAFEIED
jgi:hypothetical protein